MRSEPFSLDCSDGKSLHVHAWLPEGEVRGVVLVSHGMAEHGGRYARFARRLADAGWAVYAPDLRGHGKTAPAGELGYLGKGVGFRRLVEDLREVGEEGHRRHAGRPLVLFGHSFGSLLAEAYLSLYGAKLAAWAVSGVPTPSSPALEAAGNLVIGLGALFKGERAPGTLPKNMTFGQYAAAFAPLRTPCDWISRDQAEVDAYIADPFANFTCSYGFYRELQALIHFLYREDAIAAAPKDIPLYFFAGQADPVIGSPEAFGSLVERYKARGCRVESHLYPGARHEVLNETNRDEVEADFLAWLGKALPGAS